MHIFINSRFIFTNFTSIFINSIHVFINPISIFISCTFIYKSHCSDARQNKGSILKASVDHIRRLHREMEKVKTYEHKQRQLEDTNRVLQMRIRVCSMHHHILEFT